MTIKKKKKNNFFFLNVRKLKRKKVIIIKLINPYSRDYDCNKKGVTKLLIYLKFFVEIN
jgi:hypothetical protein